MNCTLCHKLGGGVTDANCLACHDKLDARIKLNEGLHAKTTERCITCHLEHLGKEHLLISLDEEKFDHTITDYDLKGKHARLLCSKCHRRQLVYTGLVRECVSCHKDKHNKKLWKLCEKCHDPGSWKEAKGFDHTRDSRFALTGAHLKTECAKCHAKGQV